MLQRLKTLAPDNSSAKAKVNTSESTATNRKVFGKFEMPPLKRWQKISLVVGIVSLVLLSTLAVLGIYTYRVTQDLKVQAQEARAIAHTAYTNFKTQNLPAVDSNIQELDTKLTDIESTYNKLAFYRFVPVASRYYGDGTHGLNAARAGLNAAEKSVDAVVPYADILGFAGEGTFEGGTTEDRVKVVLQTLDKVAPEIDAITQDLQVVEAELAEIDPNHYPENLRNIPVRSYVVQARELSTGAVTAVTEFRPVIEQLPAVAGGRGEPKTYLVLFQNDNELRPTGGFLTAYAIIKIEDGKVTPEKSDDIYELDQKFKERIAIPEKLGRYLTTERYYHLRDMNISPDFKTSMDTFYEHYQEVPGEPKDIDGIIAVDTHFLTNLLTVLGPVEVPGYGTFSSQNDPRCDCPQIIYALSEIITRPTPYLRQDRKGILGPLMRAILSKAYAAPKQQWPQLFETGFASVEARHAQFYFMNPDAQAAAETAAAAGRLTPASQPSDFFAVINANLGGAKSNLFTNYEMKQEVSAPENGMITKTVEITYRNTRRADNCNLEAGLLCLNSTLRDWTRIYVPSGAELIDAQGFSEKPEVYEEAGFQFFDGFFTLEPLGTAKLKLSYRVPYQDTETYRLKLWKQGGIENYNVLMDVTGGQEQLTVTKDTLYQTSF